MTATTATTTIEPVTTSLTPQPWRVIALLTQCQSVPAAARSTGLHRTQPDFALALRDTRSDFADHYRSATQARADKSLVALDNLLDDPRIPAAVRLNAVLPVLNTATTLPTPDPFESELDAIVADTQLLCNVRDLEVDVEPSGSHRAPDEDFHHNSSLFTSLPDRRRPPGASALLQLSGNRNNMNSQPEWAHALEFHSTSTNSPHQFCGHNKITGATCPSCAKPLLRLMSLDASDPTLEVDPALIPQVHLLYCWTCGIPHGTFSYHLRPDGSVELLEVPPKNGEQFGPAGPYSGYTGKYRLRQFALTRLSSEQQVQQQAAQSDDTLLPELLSASGHQVGGTPPIANPQPVVCPICSTEPPFFALVCDNASGNELDNAAARNTFTDNSGTQMVFHLCRQCSVVLAYHSCD